MPMAQTDYMSRRHSGARAVVHPYACDRLHERLVDDYQR
jgi:hypothetical protein